MSEYQENWNEFRWEKELRNDEKRIHGYFKELPRWIDLPHEEEAIFESLMHRSDLVPKEALLEARSPRFSWDMEFNDDGEGTTVRPVQSEIVEQLDRLAVEWGILAISVVRAEDFALALALSCRFGKLQLRVEDMVDAGDLPKLQRSLAKRVLSDLNALIGDLQSFGESDSSLVVPAALIIELLQNIREGVINKLVHATE